MDANNLINILFMDDESGANIVHDAIKSLKDTGYTVIPCETMERALNEFYESPIKSIFILDIDMGDETDRGSGIAKRYRSLDNQCKVIMFSARGEVEDWFEVANRHVYGYVDKNGNDPINLLLKLVEQAVEELGAGISLPDPKAEGSKVLIASDLTCPLFSLHDQEQAVTSVGFVPYSCSLDEMPEKLDQDEYTAILIFAQNFSARPSAFAPILEICHQQPRPHVIIAAEGAESSRGFILDCINAHPFRMLDLNKEAIADRLQEAIKQAAKWYGGNEVFKARVEDLEAMTSNMKPVFSDVFDEYDVTDSYDMDEVEDDNDAR